MSGMDGNPHVLLADTNPENFVGEGVAALNLAQAMLAIAHEQRTANLIAAFAGMEHDGCVTFLGERIDGCDLAKQIKERLGL